jgi:hypothetical protein
VAAVLILFGALGIILGVFDIYVLNSHLSRGKVISGEARVAVYAALALGLLEIVVGSFVLRPGGRGWIRSAAIAICALGVVGDIASLASGTAQTVVGLVVNIAIIVALTRNQAKEWFNEAVL